MKTTHTRKTFFGKPVIIKVWIILFSILVFNNCAEEPQLWDVNSQEQLIGDYVKTNPDRFSEFYKLIEKTGMESVLKTRGPFTLFLPTDEAMLEYYELKNVSSLEDFDENFSKELILYHIVPTEISTNEIGLGTLRETNANGDYLASEFVGSDIIIGKYAKVIKRDIRTANGYIHLIDRVIDPIFEDIFTLVSEDPSYSIFAEGLDVTGLKDTLKIISFPYGGTEARTRFTILAVADTTFNRYGIYNIEDLAEWCGTDMDSLDYLNNPFYRFIEYHCLNGSFFLSDLNTGIYPILSRDNNIKFTIDDDYKLNLDRSTGIYTGFNIPASNTPAKNGVIHAITDILPVTTPEPTSVIFQTTDFFDLQQGDYYGKYYKRFFDGENTFAKIKWAGPYLLYYFKDNNGALIDGDCLSMLGWWSITITFPKVMKGKYEVYILQPGWNDVTDCAIYIDGVRTNYTYTGPYGSGSGGIQKVAEVDFKTTEEHSITVRNIVTGMLFWDYVEFRPIK